MSPATGCVCLVAAALQVALQAQQPPIASLAIGAVRADGLVFPIASLEGETWRSLTTYDDVVVKLTTAARHLPRQGWHVLSRSGGEVVGLTLGGVRTVDAQCAKAEGFSSDAPAKRAGGPESPTIGVAFWGEGAAGALPERLTPPYDAAAQRITRIVVPLTHSLEAQRAEEEPTSFLAKHTAAARAGVPVRITQLVRGTTDRSTAYYFETRKRYGEESMAVSGWVRIEIDRTELAHVVSILETKSAHGAATREALGIVRAPNRDVWIMQVRGYESLLHQIFDFIPFGPTRLALTATTGGC